jgi:muconolactone delta-isomerase
MTKTIACVDGWWEDDFPFDVDDDGEMDALHEVLPDGYYVAIDVSAGYDSPDESERYIHLMNANHDE